jgi:hypothetical protein
MYRDKFVLSVIHDGHPVHETGHGIREVAIPFNSEYKVRLKNKHSRSCTARLFIDGRKVSELGDFIIGGGGTIDLERFVDRSMLEGQRFKFVSLDHGDVADPTSSDNGIIKVEFRLSKQQNGIKIKWNEPNKWPTPPVPCPWPPTFKKGGPVDSPHWNHYTSDDTSAQPRTLDGASWYFEDGGGTNSGMKCNNFIGSSLNVNYCSQVSEPMAAPGATVEGGYSNQSFVYSNLEVDSLATIIQLKIVGLKNCGPAIIQSGYRYCSQCGNKMKHADRFCSVCGRRV